MEGCPPERGLSSPLEREYAGERRVSGCPGVQPSRCRRTNCPSDEWRAALPGSRVGITNVGEEVEQRLPRSVKSQDILYTFLKN
jgi:hypothetical protein